jgi:hypothetical protein
MKRRLSIALLGLALGAGCMPISGTRSGGRSFPLSYLGLFEKLWAEHTITLSRERGGQAPASETGSEVGESAFPITVQATYMDSTIVQEGLREFVILGSMSDDQAAQFRTRYAGSHASGDSLFIWVDMQTVSTEDYLKIERWTMYLENEAGNQFEPSRIVEHPVQHQGRLTTFAAEGPGSELAAALPGSWPRVEKQVELYFPRIPIGGTHSPGNASSLLRFTILESKNPNVRAGGVWQVSGTSITRAGR